MLYMSGTGGLVLDASTVQHFCTYYGDGNSMARSCGGGYGDGTSCIPGCAPVGSQCLQPECSCWDCSFPPEHTADAIQAQINAGVQRHNEVVVDTRSIFGHLPAVVLAFFHLGNDGESRTHRQAFLAQYGLGEDRAPLVFLDLWGATDRPFSFS